MLDNSRPLGQKSDLNSDPETPTEAIETVDATVDVAENIQEVDSVEDIAEVAPAEDVVELVQSEDTTEAEETVETEELSEAEDLHEEDIVEAEETEEAEESPELAEAVAAPAEVEPEPVVEAPAAAAATVEPPQESMSEDEIRKRIATLETEIIKLAESASLSDQQMESKGDELENLVGVQEEFTDWVTKRRASYAWQLMNRIKGHERDLALDEKLIRDFSESEPVIPEGFGESTRKWFMKRFWLNFSISWIAVIILLLINRFSDQLSTWMADAFGGRSFLKNGLNFFLQQAIGLSLPQVISAIFGFSLLAFIGQLFAIHRRNSEYQQLVAEESNRTLAMEKGIDSVKQARERIDSLHPQVPQLFEVLSVGLHQPWIVNNESLMFNGSIPDTAKLPSCVEVAVPTITAKSPKYEELVNKAMNQIQIPGWRAEAFKNIMQSLAESIGFGSNNMAVRELDEDHRKTGKRQLVVTASKNPDPATLIGEALVEHYTRIVQEKVLPFSQPQVVSLRPDPLAGLQLDGSLSMSGSVYEVNWQEKLAEIADLASPWSALSFSDKGTANNRHQHVESIFIASERVPSREGVVKESAVNPGARPFEVAIRVDLSEWCKPDEVAVFSDFKPTQEQLARWERGGSTHGTKLLADGAQHEPTPGAENLVI
jgi:hypothetical protein